MKIYTNHTIIKRNKKIGQVTTIASLVVLGLGLVLSFQTNSNLFLWSMAALIIGFLLSQIGIYYGNRWGRTPRPDEKINAALKGLDDKYCLYHYKLSVPHLLIGPAGIWIIVPFSQAGLITYEEKNDRWKQKGGNWYLKIFAQEGLGRPDLEVRGLIDTFQKLLSERFGELELSVQAAMVFYNPKVSVEAPDAPIPTMELEKLKDFLRKKSKEKSITPETLQILEDDLPSSD